MRVALLIWSKLLNMLRLIEEFDQAARSIRHPLHNNIDENHTVQLYCATQCKLSCTMQIEC